MGFRRRSIARCRRACQHGRRRGGAFDSSMVRDIVFGINSRGVGGSVALYGAGWRRTRRTPSPRAERKERQPELVEPAQAKLPLMATSTARVRPTPLKFFVLETPPVYIICTNGLRFLQTRRILRSRLQ
jgi:hypothetical protein